MTRRLNARVLLWVGLTLAAATTLYRASAQAILDVLLRPMHVVDAHMVHAWGVLALCLGGLWLKRASLAPAARVRWVGHAPYALLGLGWLALSTLLFAPAALLAGAVGLYALVCGRAARWPSALMGVYLLAAGLPALTERFADRSVGLVTAAATGAVLRTAGYPLARYSQDLSLVDAGGRTIRVLINASCAGPATMGVFLAIFVLMAVDVPLPWRPSALLLVGGMAGTWLQNVGRLVYLLLVGYYQGEPALWAAHADSGYLWFTGWYALFAVLYLWVAGRARSSREDGPLARTLRGRALTFWRQRPILVMAGWNRPG